MRMLKPVRMSGEDNGPVWARSRRRSRGAGPLIGFLVSLLAIFGAIMVVASVKEGSIAGGGAFVDHWTGKAIQWGKDAWAEATADTEQAADAVAEEVQPAVDGAAAAGEAAATTAQAPAPAPAPAQAPAAKAGN